MRVVTLASSSKGNCTLVWTDSTKILIDLGVACSECEMKLKALGIDPDSISAILNTHCHSDHTKGIATFARKHHTPVYVHMDGASSLIPKLDKVAATQIKTFGDDDFAVGDMLVHAFKLPHDVPCCVGYSIMCGDNKFSYATDLGHMTDDILSNLIGSKLVVLESNHDKAMLIANPHYTSALKARILSDNGHLCNDDTAKAILKLALTGTKQVVLAHLSEENNTPDIAYSTTAKYLAQQNIIEGTNIRVAVADPYKIGTVFNLK